ncbi:Rqc2 family fibronectin-binding protein [Hippea sp. KM1]|uniref:Rqc2 family fibronectin-binding protein n=1 Tax=Hippea sp. KM1 TaxID=944481 RepID=UPI00046D5620|nr:NFACT family protein [Hippea sp. KM1]
MNHYLFKYAIEQSRDIFLEKKVRSLHCHPFGIYSISFYDTNKRLYFSLSPQNSFLMPFEDKLKDEIKDCPNFMMFLSKKLKGLRLTGIQQSYSERVVYFILEDKRGHIVYEYRLVFEIMGRLANLILTDGEGAVIQAYKYTDSSRQIAPKKPYIPPVSNMPDILKDDEALLVLKYRHNEDILGLSGHLRRFLTDERMFLGFVRSARDAFEKRSFELHLYPKNEVYPFYMPISVRRVDNGFLYNMFIEKPQRVEFDNIKSNLRRVFTRRLNSLKRRLEKVRGELKKAEDYDKFRIYAENLFARPNLKVGYEGFVEVEDLYTKESIKIPINPELNIFENAQNFYKKYKKAKHSIEIVKQRLIQTEEEIGFIRQLLFDLEQATTVDDVESIKSIAQKEGLIKLPLKPKKRKGLDYLPYEHMVIEGYDAYVGKNAYGNDIVSLKLASKNDLWFHAKGIAGSHVVLKVPSKLQDVDDSVKIKAARIAACRSGAKKLEMVDVDYTQAKYVKKPKNAKTGMVIYSNFKTIRVRKDECS